MSKKQIKKINKNFQKLPEKTLDKILKISEILATYKKKFARQQAQIDMANDLSFNDLTAINQSYSF